MANLATGGGSAVVAASAHAGCRRYRHTDQMLTNVSRRELSRHLGHPDSTAGIPEARWMRAMTFESLVRHDRFVSQLLTTAVGRLDLARPTGVRRSDGRVSTASTATALHQAHLKAMHEGVATMITSLAVPFVGLEGHPSATPVKPDFAIVTPRLTAADPQTAKPAGTWLIMGDAKDYERVRSRIDDQRMLKGFLQVAVGALSAEAWSQLHAGMAVHQWGALAVPRNNFLQPIAVVEDLRDHRAEVMARVREREDALAAAGHTPVTIEEMAEYVAHLEMSFDPGTCSACALHDYCRAEVRSRPDPQWRLAEIGVPTAQRAALIDIVDGSDDVGAAPLSLVAQVRATVTGLPQWTGALRVDPVGLPGTINLVLAKSDAAALGVYGLGMRVVTSATTDTWDFTTFDDPQAATTRLAIMENLGRALDSALSDRAEAAQGTDASQPDPVNIVVPDNVTADVLVSMADSLAGIEISRLRWSRDLEMGRTPLTYDGEPAVLPAPLTNHQRLAVSFLLDADRSRALTLRTALVDARKVLAFHVTAGGALFESQRLDYLVRWAQATQPLDHREVSDEIRAAKHTPGARLSNAMSNAVHKALGDKGNTASGHGRGRENKGWSASGYEALVANELSYKAKILDRVEHVLSQVDDSVLRIVHQVLEADAQAVWRRRWKLHASDLVRFGRVAWWWRNDQVGQMDKDNICSRQLSALGSPRAAYDMATSAGTREVAMATVVATTPLRLAVHSRRIGEGSVVHLAHSDAGPSLERDGVELKVQVGSFKFSGQPVGRLEADKRTASDGSLLFAPGDGLGLGIGSDVVLLDGSWIVTFKRGFDIAVDRPKLDTNSAPKAGCEAGDYEADPEAHGYCCRSHESREAEMSDWFATQRAEGKMNPEVWPPLVDHDAFDTPAVGAPTDAGADANTIAVVEVPEDLTIDDID